jgi:hypothetical protein
VLSIEDDYHFLREPVKIWYNPDTLLPTNYIQENTCYYLPDFLIRHKTNNCAWPVEVKPRKADCSCQVQTGVLVAEHYIKQHQLDWRFATIYDDELFLSPGQQAKFDLFYRCKDSLAAQSDLEQLQRKYSEINNSFFSTTPFFDGAGMTHREYSNLVRTGRRIAD